MVMISYPSPPHAWFPLNFFNSFTLSAFLFTSLTTNLKFVSILSNHSSKHNKICEKTVTYMHLWTHKTGCCELELQQCSLPWHHRKVFSDAGFLSALETSWCDFPSFVIYEGSHVYYSHYLSHCSNILRPNCFISSIWFIFHLKMKKNVQNVTLPNICIQIIHFRNSNVDTLFYSHSYYLPKFDECY